VPRYDEALAEALGGLPSVPSDVSLFPFKRTIIAESMPSLWRAATAWRAGEVEIAAVNDVAIALNAKLRTAGLGYFVHPQFDTDAHGRVATLRTYQIREIAIAIVGADRFAVLTVEPIGATLTPSAAGQTFQGIPIVHTRAVTSDAVGLVSVLSTKRVIAMGQPALEAALDALVLAEVQTMFGADVTRATEVGALLVQWAQLRNAPYLDVERERQVGPAASHALDAVEDALDQKDARRLIDVIQRRTLRRVQLHEMQHALDWKTERAFELSAPLVAVLGNTLDLRGQVLASMELSAWTATFAREFSWFDIVTGLAAAHTEGVPTGFSVAFLIDNLTHRFDARAKPALRDGVIDRDRLAANTLVLAQRSPSELAAAARALWEGWYGTKLETIELR
jgi:hypothetical protein